MQIQSPEKLSKETQTSTNQPYFEANTPTEAVMVRNAIKYAEPEHAVGSVKTQPCAVLYSTTVESCMKLFKDNYALEVLKSVFKI